MSRQSARIAVVLSLSLAWGCGGGGASNVVKQIAASGGGAPVSDAVCPVDPPSLVIAAPDPVPTAEVGWTPGSFAVTSSGEATYTIPLTVPPGRMKMAPSLSIAYSSGGGDGPLGRGFTLTGQSSVTRCLKNFELDGDVHAVAFDDSDAYCLDGQRLVVVSSSGIETEYRTLPDTHVRVKSYRTGVVQGPVYWIVESPGGNRSWYGFAADSRLLARTGFAASWALSRTEDRSGNGILYKYQIDNDSIVESGTKSVYTKEHYLSEIAYTTPSLERKVELEYLPVTARHRFRGGMDLVSSHRLKTIHVKGPGGVLVRDYELSYDGDDLFTSKLTSVRECVVVGLTRRCLKPTSFEWAATANGPSYMSVTKVPLTVNDQMEWTTGDVNGDGLNDLIISSIESHAAVFRVALGTGDVVNPFQKAESWAELPTSLTKAYKVQAVDLDGDGRADVIPTTSDDDGTFFVGWLRSESPNAGWSTPHLTFQLSSIPRQAPSGFSKGDNAIRAGDFDGDGRVDLVRCERQSWVTPPAGARITRYLDVLGPTPKAVGSRIYFHRNLGGGQFGPAELAYWSNDCEWFDASAKVADPEGAGRSSLLDADFGVGIDVWASAQGSGGVIPFGYSAGAHWEWTRKPNGVWESVRTRLPDGTANDHAVGPYPPVIVDVNGDGVVDSVVFEKAERPCNADEDFTSCWSIKVRATYGQSPVGPPDTWPPNGVKGYPPPTVPPFVWGFPDLPQPGEGIAVGTSGSYVNATMMPRGLAYSAMPIQWDEDNLMDVLAPMVGTCPTLKETACWVVLRSTGAIAAPFEVIKTDIPYRGEFEEKNTKLKEADRHHPLVVDTDGDGRSDIVSVDEVGNVVVYRHLAAKRQVVRIYEGRNGREAGDAKRVASFEIEYGALIDRNVRNADLAIFDSEYATANTAPGPKLDDLYKSKWLSQSCTYPVSCVVGTQQVVSRYWKTDGLDGRRGTAMMYRDGRYDVRGHRWLGFGAVFRVDTDSLAGDAAFSDNETYDANLKVYPWAGMPTRSWQWVPALPGQPAKDQLRLTLTKVIPVIVPTVGGSYFRYAGITNVQTVESTFDPSGGFYGILAKVEAEANSPTKVISAVTKVVSNVDAYGNVLAEISKVGTEIEKVTRTFKLNAASLASWLLRQEETKEVCSTANGKMFCRNSTTGYDANGFPVFAKVGDDAKPSTVLKTYLTRNAQGNVTATVTQDGFGETRSTCATYDAEGVFVVMANNSKNIPVYSKYDRGLGAKVAQMDANNVVTRWVYDGFGRLGRVVNPDGTAVTTSLSYATGCGSDGGAQCTVVETTSSVGSWGQAITDELGRAVKTRSAGPDVPTCTEAGVCEKYAVIVTDQTFDHFGRLVKKTLPYIEKDNQTPRQYEEYQFDALGREVVKKLPSGLVVNTAYDGLVTTTTNGYSTKIVLVDEKGRVVSSKDGSDTVGYPETTTVYGPFSLPEVITVRAGASTTVTQKQYDDYGRLLVDIDPDKGTTTTSYNGYGEVRMVTDALGRSVTMYRDKLGRVETRLDTVNGSSESTTFEYDTGPNAKGKLSAVYAPTSNVKRYAYDAIGRVKESTVELGGETFKTNVEYDPIRGLVDKVSYPDDGGLRFWVKNNYDSRGNLVEVKGLRLGGWVGSLNTLWSLDEVNLTGGVHQETFGNQVRTVIERSPVNGMVTSIETETAGGKSIQSFAYSYDARGDLETRTDNAQHVSQIPGLSGATESFSYDDLGRLTHVYRGVGLLPQFDESLEVTYHLNGNIKSKSDVGAYHYDDPAHPHGVTLVNLAQMGTEYTYDAVGNQKTRGGVTVDYNTRNKPTRYALPTGQVTFDYAGDGERLVKRTQTSDLNQTQVWIGNLYERRVNNGSGEVEHRFHVFGGGRVVADVLRTAAGPKQSDSVEYQHVDHLGSLHVTTDDKGEPGTPISFDAFGKRRDPDWMYKVPTTFDALYSLGFAGQQEDHEIGAINMNARLYDPRIGRFLNVDPLVTNPLNAQTWNGYSYVRNKPTVLVDPTGMGETSEAGEFTIGDDQCFACAAAVVPTGKVEQYDSEGTGGVGGAGPSGGDQAYDVEGAAAYDSSEIRRTHNPESYQENITAFRDGPAVVEYEAPPVRMFRNAGTLAGEIVVGALKAVFQNACHSGNDCGDLNRTSDEVLVLTPMMQGLPLVMAGSKSSFAELAPSIQYEELGEVTFSTTSSGARNMTIVSARAPTDMGFFRFTSNHFSDGALTLDLQAGPTALLRGQDWVAMTMDHYGLKNVSRIDFSWNYGTNRAAFEKMVAEGVPELEAATKTWTGQRAADYGFTNPTLDTNNVFGQTGSFTKVPGASITPSYFGD